MKIKTSIIFLLYFIIIFFSGFKPAAYKSNMPNKAIDVGGQSHFQDSLKLLDGWKIDCGFNQDITFWGDTTYNLYKKKIRWVPGVAMQILEFKSVNSFVFIKFNSNHEIEKIQCTSLKKEKSRSKLFSIKNIYKTNYFGFKIGDNLPCVLKRLKGLEYKIERNLPSKKDVCVEIHGLIEFKGITSTTYDEYICTYCFVNSKLDLIEINYFRDASPRLGSYSKI